MTSNQTTPKGEKAILILKWAFSILALSFSIISISKLLIWSATAFSLISLLIFPPFTQFFRSKLPFLQKKIFKLFLLIFLGIFGFATVPKKRKDTEKKNVRENIFKKLENDETTDSITNAVVNSNLNSTDSVVRYDASTGKEIERTVQGQINSADELKKIKRIANIIPADIYSNFERLGYKTNKEIHSDGSIWTNTKEDNGIQYSVTTYCEDGVSKVDEVRFTATRILPQYNKLSDLKPFLKYGCSTIFYDKADRDRINEFIEKNYSKNKATIIVHGVRFTIFAPTEFMRYIRVDKNND